MLAALLAVPFSGALLFLLGRRDPKRLRAAAARHVAPLTRAQRRILASSSLAPGALLALAGQSAGFVIWLGATVVLGWLLTQLFAVSGHAPRDTHAS